MISAVGRYLLGVLVALDQLANAILGGDPDETISSRLGKARRGDFGPSLARLTAPIRWAVDAVFRVVFRQARHCESSIEEDEGGRDIVRTLRRSGGL
ncbi:hypothetical protein [Azospirillum sp. TSH64]|uniref:hypothetical protein n=1 Tax=Azospirillum sp. TSH64 TaxID=652740 RepID=UPI000D61C79B|nr:hypothetical protein [Azospirillum sp. TSH64]PWC81246.1 hypothetical protein TSH64_00960 [Azospirillum sp. TSH64]